MSTSKSTSKIWVQFEKVGCSASGKTHIWNVVLKDDLSLVLGVVKWFGAWRKYVFFPAEYTLYEQDCLRALADFCELETRLQKHPEEKLK
jgi:hypothetical protein